jgi:folate-binding Fe-S cluster repair protein YgfZ
MQADSVLQAVQQSAVVVEQPDWGTLAVSGPDARAWLNGILTCDIKDLAPGTGA